MPVGMTGSLFPELESDKKKNLSPAPIDPSPAVDDHPELPGHWLVEIALKVPLDQTFSYRIPPALREQVGVGQRCQVPFGRRNMTGFVVGLPEETCVPGSKLRGITSLLDAEPVFNDEMLSLCQWLSRYYASPLAEVLEVALPKSVIREWKRRKMLRPETILTLTDAPREGRLGAGATRIIKILEERDQGASLENLLEAAEVARGTVRRCIGKGWLEARNPDDEEETLLTEIETKPVLNEEQGVAVHALKADIDSQDYSCSLLYGITGSGKTEVYLRIIEHCLALDKGAIVLVPEIALTPQTTRRFRARFGGHVAVLHSALSDYERWKAWQRVKKGEAKVVIGPRSALFAPVQNLGLIVVDEEHETTYKQERSPRYHARDVAVVRARRLKAVVVLGSATPSLESFQNALDGRYRLLRLRHRAGEGKLPKVEIVDMGSEWREVKGMPLISRQLKKVVQETLDRGERAILFLNRRGFTTFLHCRQCQYVHKCPHCDIALTFHKNKDIVLCHFCAEQSNVPKESCPDCHGPPLKHRGAGTERIEEVCRHVFPTAKIERVDSDTVRSGDKVEVRLGRFRRGETDLLIGTQMIARGLDIPEVTAVGIINADTSLGHPDFRATERTFQLIAQVAGRAGRGRLVGRTIVQTFNPKEPSILAAAQHDFECFANREIPARKMLGYPPFGRLLHLLIRNEDQRKTEAEANRLVDYLKQMLPKNCKVLGPAISPRAYLANKFRFQALIKAPNPAAIQDVMFHAMDFKETTNVEVVLDRDPTFLL
jgi:primosomal protein N' (replication factor Y) (superfamily II helicase)